MTDSEKTVRDEIRQAMLEMLDIDIDNPDDSEEPGITLPRDENYDDALNKVLFSRWKNASEREQEILVFRYGLAGGEKHSEEETAAAYGVVNKEVRQIEFKVFGHRQRGSNAEKLREHFKRLKEKKQKREWKYQW